MAFFLTINVNGVRDHNKRLSFLHWLSHLACLYAPNRNPERNDFFAYRTDQNDATVPTVICGDFNTVFDRSLDCRGVNVSDTSRERSFALGNLFCDCCVVNIWRFLHPATVAFTWLRPDGTFSSRIDLIGCPHSWVHRVDSCQILTCPFSNHSAVILKVSIPEPIPLGPGRWKLNSSILADVDFVASVKIFWSSWRLKKASFGSLLSWWDRGNERIKGLAINHCEEKAKHRNLSRTVFVTLADHLKSKIDLGHVSLLPIYHNVSSKIASLDLSTAQGAKVHSRIKWAEVEKPPRAIF